MKFTPLTAAAALSCLVLLGACSGSDDDEDQGSSAAERTQDAGAATAGDAAAATADAEQVTGGPDGVGVISVEQAQDIATELLTAAAKANNGDGSKIKKDVDAAYDLFARTAVLAADTLESVNGDPDKIDIEGPAVKPNVLAISREDDDRPLLVLVQTVPESGVPELHVIASDDGPEDFRIIWSAPMLPGTEIGTFDRRSVGSPILREGKASLPQSPRQLMGSLADYIDYPVRDVTEVQTSGYAPQVRKAAQAQAQAVSIQAEFSESNSLAGSTYTFFREDGSAVTFATLERESEFDIRGGNELTPPKVFLEFKDDTSIVNKATLDTLVFVAMTIPNDSSRPEMIAAREQVVGASGS